MDTQSLREAALNTPRKQEALATPFWPGTDGHVALLDVATDEITELRQSLMEGDRKDPAAFTAALLCRALINKETGERLFQDADRDAVKKMGSSITNPIAKQLTQFLGLDTKAAVEDAKKN